MHLLLSLLLLIPALSAVITLGDLKKAFQSINFDSVPSKRLGALIGQILSLNLTSKSVEELPATIQMVVNLFSLNYTTFPQGRYIKALFAHLEEVTSETRLGLICHSLFCHFEEDAVCSSLCEHFSKLKVDDDAIDAFVESRRPTKSQKDCVDRLTKLFGTHHTVLAPLCAVHYEYNKHKLYEEELIDFGKQLVSEYETAQKKHEEFWKPHDLRI